MLLVRFFFVAIAARFLFAALLAEVEILWLFIFPDGATFFSRLQVFLEPLPFLFRHFSGNDVGGVEVALFRSKATRERIKRARIADRFIRIPKR